MSSTTINVETNELKYPTDKQFYVLRSRKWYERVMHSDRKRMKNGFKCVGVALGDFVFNAAFLPLDGTRYLANLPFCALDYLCRASFTATKEALGKEVDWSKVKFEITPTILEIIIRESFFNEFDIEV